MSVRDLTPEEALELERWLAESPAPAPAQFHTGLRSGLELRELRDWLPDAPSPAARMEAMRQLIDDGEITRDEALAVMDADTFFGTDRQAVFKFRPLPRDPWWARLAAWLFGDPQ